MSASRLGAHCRALTNRLLGPLNCNQLLLSLLLVEDVLIGVEGGKCVFLERLAKPWLDLGTAEFELRGRAS